LISLSCTLASFDFHPSSPAVFLSRRSPGSDALTRPRCRQLVCFYYVLTTFTTIGYGEQPMQYSPLQAYD
jgi:hypothetical protein